MINTIEIMYVRDNVPAWERQLHLNTLLAPHRPQAKTADRTELLNYLAAIDCTIQICTMNIYIKGF